MNALQLEMQLGSAASPERSPTVGQDTDPEVSPYLQRPLRTLSEARHEHDTALLELTATDGRIKPVA